MVGKYYVYIIKCTTTNKIFVGVTSVKDRSILPWLLRQNESYKNTDNPRYTKLGESVATNGFKNHVYSKFKGEFDDKEKAEIAVFNIQKKLGDNILNDCIANPEKVDCEGCGKRVKVMYLEAHKEKYCTGKIFSEYEYLIDEALSNENITHEPITDLGL